MLLLFSCCLILGAVDGNQVQFSAIFIYLRFLGWLVGWLVGWLGGDLFYLMKIMALTKQVTMMSE